MKVGEGWVERLEALQVSLGTVAWPLLISLIGVMLTFWVTRRGQTVQERRDRTSELTDFRRDVLAENRDLRERLGAAEMRADALALHLDAAQREVLTLKASALKASAPPLAS